MFPFLPFLRFKKFTQKIQIHSNSSKQYPMKVLQTSYPKTYTTISRYRGNYRILLSWLTDTQSCYSDYGLDPWIQRCWVYNYAFDFCLIVCHFYILLRKYKWIHFLVEKDLFSLNYWIDCVSWWANKYFSL